MQFNRSNLVDVGLACKVVLVTSKPIIESFSISVQSLHAELGGKPRTQTSTYTPETPNYSPEAVDRPLPDGEFN